MLHLQVRYEATGKEYYVRPRVMRSAQPPGRLLVADTTKQYRDAALRYARPGDVVLEVGCHEGAALLLLLLLLHTPSPLTHWLP
jgi:hypothetical protein